MAAPPQFQRLSREDFKEAPSWIERLLYWLNLFVDYVTTSLNHGLTFDDNIQAQIKGFQVLAGATPQDNLAQFLVTMRVAPRGLMLMRVAESVGNYAPIGAAVSVEWRYDSGTVFVTSITGLTSGKTYDFVVLLV